MVSEVSLIFTSIGKSLKEVKTSVDLLQTFFDDTNNFLFAEGSDKELKDHKSTMVRCQG